HAGDLRLYGLVQFLPMLLIPAILLTYRSVFDQTRFIWVVFLLYALAKVFEQLDATIYGWGEVISGHSIKHVCAALGPIVLIYGGMRRRPRQPAD
ncbi:MAG: alkaline phytoceramidase, partial [Proteobacteria bacterium]|nr:alkaline phytoceramidase [Pseudomonadota bacterium]